MADNGIVQTQWSIDNTVFGVLIVLYSLFQAAQADDVQNSAVFAFEALGQASFLKTFLTDEEIGGVLHEMLILQGLTRKPQLRCSRPQLKNVISAISGYSDQIIPTHTVSTLVAALRGAGLDTEAMRQTFRRPQAKELARILSLVFGALQKDDIDFVSLEGIANCVIVASSFLWLNEGEVQFMVGDQVLQAAARPRILIRIPKQATRQPETNTVWTIQEWREGSALSTLVVPNLTDSLPGSPALTSFTPACIAKQVLAAQYGLKPQQINDVGKLATSLVLVAIERGVVTLEKFEPGVAPRECRLQAMCQGTFLSSVLNCMGCYGWTEEETRGAEEFATEIKEWTETGFPGLEQGSSEQEQRREPHPLTQRPLGQMTWILRFIERRQATRSGRPARDWGNGVYEAAIYVAAQAVYSSICARFPERRFFKTGAFDSINEAGMHILHWVTRHEGLRDLSDLPLLVRRLTRVIGATSLHAFRCCSIASLLPGAESLNLYRVTGALAGGGVQRQDLAYAVNGYVAWLPQLRTISTSPTDAMAIEIASGYIRTASSETSQESLQRIQSEELMDHGAPQPPMPLHPFDEFDNYTGVPQFSDKDDLNVKHYLNQTGKVLKLRTFIYRPAGNHHIAVDWLRSVEALATATHHTNQSLPAFAEQALAKRWQGEQVWSSIGVTAADAVIKQHVPEAGVHRIHVRHGDTSVLKFIQQALDGEREKEAQGRGNFPGVSKSVQPGIDPRRAEQVIRPGWLIIL
ncbi:hypothetical protein QBC37DRAFT_475957 [Rhypophila decipiens]|uniref:Uncharacterized protein n=1 Tax=Rhypophila decipiens TaxID=261697 RepID=A0AAN6XXW2_9PEZI|nr:hypothetical protein QBC37DRAFT_475957 [Rhypophila decipiens]